MVISYNNKFTDKRFSSVSNLIITYSLVLSLFAYPSSPTSQMHTLGHGNVFQALI